MRKILAIAIVCVIVWLLVMIMLASQPPRAMGQSEPTMLSTSWVQATYTPILRPWPIPTQTVTPVPEPTETPMQRLSIVYLSLILDGAQ